MILLDALYVNNSGGKILLDYLISRLLISGKEVFFLLDKRCEESYCNLHLKNVKFVHSTLKNRLEFYRNDNKKFTSILCFANIPPPVKCDCEVYTYFHNLLLSEIPAGTPIKKVVLLWLKRQYLRRNLRYTDEVWVQTEYSRHSFLRAFGNKNKVRLLPFFNDFGLKPGVKIPNSFLYVSDGNPHKNHSRLLEAWSMAMPKDAVLWLTISKNYPETVNLIKIYQEKGCSILNFQNLNRESLNKLYEEAQYLIYPSLLESFGLGLIEGVLAGCNVVSSDLPYVRQVVEPIASFRADDVKDIREVLLKVYHGGSQGISTLNTSNMINELITMLK